MTQQLLLKPSPLLYLVPLFAYPYLALKSMVVKATFLVNILIFGLFTLIYLMIVWWNFVTINITDDSLEFFRGFFIKKFVKKVQINDIKDLVFITTRGGAAGSDITVMMLSLSIKESSFFIHSFQHGQVIRIDGKSQGSEDLLKVLEGFLKTRTLAENMAWVYQDTKWYQVFKNDAKYTYTIKDLDGKSWEDVEIKSLKGNQIDIYQNGNLVLGNVDMTLTLQALVNSNQSLMVK
ncbi:MAG: hypothetical protein AB7I27_00110 [Bacteriovoracaceae bacterium]